MIRIGLIALLAALCAASASAQVRTYDPVVPRGLPDQRPVEPAGELSQPTAQPAAGIQLRQNARRASHDADARHCLDRANNKSIHRCAQPYLSREARASVKQARAKPRSDKPAATVPTAVETPKAVDAPRAGTGGGARPEDKAKAADLVKPMDVTKAGGTPKPVEAAKAPEAGKTAEKKPLALPKMGSQADPTAAK